MKKNKAYQIQKLNLLQEFEVSGRLLQLGLGELQKISGANDFYHLPFLLLSSGFERLMKCIKCIKHFKDNNSFPKFSSIKTHNLITLKKYILNNCISPKTVTSRQITVEDIFYLKNDKELDTLLSILSEFGESARYYHLDVVVEKPKPSRDVQSMWEKYENDLVSKDTKLNNLQKENTDLDILYKEINKRITIKFEKCISALVRQLTLGGLGRDAAACACVSYISHFLYLYGDDFGKTNYNKLKIS